jgi:hypothetical protein
MVFAAIVLAHMANAFEGRSTVTSLRVLGQATNRLLVGWSPSSSWRCSGGLPGTM